MVGGVYVDRRLALWQVRGGTGEMPAQLLAGCGALSTQTRHYGSRHETRGTKIAHDTYTTQQCRLRGDICKQPNTHLWREQSPEIGCCIIRQT